MSSRSFFEFLSEVRRNRALAFGLTDILCTPGAQNIHVAVATYARDLGYDVYPSDVGLFQQRLEILMRQDGDLPDDWLEEITGGAGSVGHGMAWLSGHSGLPGYVGSLTGCSFIPQSAWT